MLSSGSPSTSLSTMDSTLAGAHRWAKRPPFTADRCLRMVLSSTISAPQASSRLVTSAISPSVTPGSGISNSADPPPDTRNTTRSSSESPSAASNTRCAARTPFSSGTGCPASMISIPGIEPSEWPYFVITTPERRRLPSMPEAAEAIFQAAFPIAITCAGRFVSRSSSAF